jgi:serine/threonine-protein kinase
LDRTRQPSTGHGDTISNKNDDTLASARSEVVRGKGLSASDSGRLVDIKPRLDLIEGSFLDLQVESGYRPNSGVSQRNAAGRGPVQRERKADVLSQSGSSRSGIRLDADPNHTTTRDSGLSSGRLTKSKRRQGLDPMLIGALITALFIVALAMGFFLARITG